MRVKRTTRLWAAMALIAGCVLAGGTWAGFCLGGWWGAQAGLLAAAAAFTLPAWIAVRLRDLYRDDFWDNVVIGDGRAEGAAEMALWGALQYQAVAFPLSPTSISETERHVRRTVAYKSAAHDTLPLAVRVAAADALDVMDQGQDKTAANEAIKVLHDAVRECRTGYLRINKDETA
ncbi:hypothetical protein OHB41_51860 [Streptomyces sp. NBC_01571]|uniref:hypothetical protein n=1 Tax=Streptomyces sp. NBC_01571 TaxID=2975883 RepID=UPI0022541E32|nr:hypothetical protein [Streptomyces sp. NBC_01571]MCX4581457.1 hypothetical protein [Streptomyces sp. NBC_01571]